jgi:iron complex outermembrane receptor protein
MKIAWILFSLVLSAFSFHLNAQNSFKALLKDDATEEPIIGAAVTIDSLKIGAVTDTTGLVTLTHIPNGNFQIKFKSMGYSTKTKILHFPLASRNKVFDIDLESSTNEMNEVVVSITRSSRSIEDIPIKVDVVADDDLGEKGMMQPSNIALLFNETTGVLSQQTSAVSGATTLRMQGLDGRYTTMLNDGMPLYQGFSGGLSIVQIAPMNLQQVEFIKGSASTLYGGCAIGGVINLVTKEPQVKRKLSFLLNGTSAKGWDGSEFYAQRWGKVGVTLFSTYDHSTAYDPAHIGFSAIPQIGRFTINPKLFLYFDKNTTAWFGINSSFENRLGGDMNVIAGNADSTHQYFQRNNSTRLSTQLSFNHHFNKKSQLNVKNSVSFFGNDLQQPGININGQQVSSFSEVNYQYTTPKSEWIAGANVWTDHYQTIHPLQLQYQLATVGAFVQNTFTPVNWFSLETGLRLDHSNVMTNSRKNEFFLLTQVNALAKINGHWNSRLGGGLGYKMPSPFGFDSYQATSYEVLPPLNVAQTLAERSYGGNWDMIYQTGSDQMSFSVDEMLFATRLNHPLIVQNNALMNANGYILTQGSETNVKFTLNDLNLFAGYTYTMTQQHFDGQNLWQPLTPKHLLYLDFAYEAEGNFRTGIEADYTSNQQLMDGSIGRGNLIVSLLAEKMWKKFNVFFNVENIANVRQSNWGPIYSGTITHPVFQDVYAPLEGRMFNLGIQIHV